MAQNDGPPAYSLPIHAAEQLRAAGRELALAGDHEAALAKYTEAAAAFARAGFAKGVGVCLTNRAIVAGKLGLWAEAYCDAARGARAFPGHAKAWFRAAAALEALGKPRAASSLYYRAVEADEKLYAQCTPRIQRCREASVARTREQASRALVAVDDEADDRSPLAPVPRPPPTTPAGKVWIGLGAGRCGLHSLARLAGLGARSAAACLSCAPDDRPLLWAPGEARGAVAARRLAALEKVRGADVVGDIHWAWLPYARAVLEVAPATRFVVLRRERRACVESWYYWTEAGARRRTEHGDAPGFGAAKNPFADHDAAEWEWDEWDLTLPNHAAATKRGAIRAFYDAYYAACAELEREFPANVRTYDCEALFESEAEQRDLFAWLGIHGDPPRERVCENQQRYLYLAPEGDDDAFVAGDFAERLDDDESATASSDDDDEARTVAAPRRASPRGAAPDARRMLAVVVPVGARPGDKVNFTFRGVAIQATVPAGCAPGDKFHVPAPDRPDDPRHPPVPPAPPPPPAPVVKADTADALD